MINETYFGDHTPDTPGHGETDEFEPQYHTAYLQEKYLEGD